MCVFAYIGSSGKLPEIQWNKEKPELYIQELDKKDNAFKDLARLFQLPFLYFVGSFKECSCGLRLLPSVYSASTTDDSYREEMARSVRDNQLLLDYLNREISSKKLKLLMTWWDENEFPEESFPLPGTVTENFYFPEEVVLALTTST